MSPAESPQVDVAEKGGAGSRPVEPSRDLLKGALARAGRSHDRGERPAREIDRHAVERDNGAIALPVDLADFAKSDCRSRRGRRSLQARGGGGGNAHDAHPQSSSMADSNMASGSQL